VDCATDLRLVFESVNHTVARVTEILVSNYLRGTLLPLSMMPMGGNIPVL
jgi:hypothetical protein